MPWTAHTSHRAAERIVRRCAVADVLAGIDAAALAVRDHIVLEDRMEHLVTIDPTKPECERCDGCGKIGSDATGAPWTFWQSLKPGEDIAVRMGLVRPLPCPVCEGTGRQP